MPDLAQLRLDEVTRPIEESNFTTEDFALFYHYTTSIARLLAHDPAETSPWVTLVPSLAPQHPYLLHGILAISAVHQRDLKPDEAQRYTRIATEHQSKALRLFRAALNDSNSSAEKAVATFLCSALFWAYYFVTADDPAHLLFNPERRGPPDWMFPIRGCHALYNQNTTTLRAAPLATLLDNASFRDGDELLAEDFPSKKALAELRDRLPLPAEDKDMYLADLKELAVSFATSDCGGVSARTAPLRFAAGATAGFLDRLATREQPALVMMVFWCVLMYRVPRIGWIPNGRAKEMLVILLRLLTPESTALVKWPIEQMGGLD